MYPYASLILSHSSGPVKSLTLSSSTHTHNTNTHTFVAPGDYGSLTNFRIGPFNDSVRQLSFNVSIRNDSIPEDDKMFNVSLTLDPADQARLGNRVIVSPDIATVTVIEDNDRKQYTLSNSTNSPHTLAVRMIPSLFLVAQE